ncbi:hypothetical protein ACFQ0B_19700 [Nonomuraea thailandensis]
MRSSDASRSSATHDFEALRTTAVTLLTGGDFDITDPVYARPLAALSERAATWLAQMVPGLIWPDLPLEGRPGHVTGSYGRLRAIAAAWATPGTAQHGDDAVAAKVIEALDLLYERHYNERLPETGNWWFWEIGTPAELSRACVLLGDRLDAPRLESYLGAIDRFCPDADRRAGWPDASESGANRADKAAIVAFRGVAGRRADKLALARDGLSDVRDGGRHSVFGYVDSGDGFHRDGSFIQHDVVAYTGSYGLSLLIAVSETVALLHGSPWEISDPGQQVVLDAVERSFAPFIHDGLLMDTVRGRAATRQAFPDSVAGHGATGAVLLLARSAPEPYRGRFRSWPRAGSSAAGRCPTWSTRAWRRPGGRSRCWTTRRSRPRPGPTGTSCSPRWTGSCTGGRDGRWRSACRRSGPPRTRRSTARTGTAGTPATA